MATNCAPAVCEPERTQGLIAPASARNPSPCASFTFAMANDGPNRMSTLSTLRLPHLGARVMRRV